MKLFGLIKERILLITFASLLAFIIFPTSNASAQLADGKYSVQYTVTQPDSNSASMANDYFLKPATLFVENGETKVQIKMKNSSWLTKFQAESGGNSVISKDSATNTRIVQFNVKDVSAPVFAQIQVDIDEMDYHHDYTIRFMFDTGSAVLISGGEAKAETKSETSGSKESSTQATSTADKTAIEKTTISNMEKNPQTSDTTYLFLFVMVLAASAFLLIRRMKLYK